MARRSLLGFESKHEPLLGQKAFARRVARSATTATLLIALSLFVGMTGYHYFEDMPWIDSFANAAMLLSGMGPLGMLKTWGGKLFAGLYALYSGLALLVAISIIAAPVVHRILHRFHVEAENE